MMKAKIFLTISLVFSAFFNLSWAQRAREIQIDNEPVNWSDPVNIIVLIIIPLLMIFIGLMARRRYLKKKES